MLYCTLVMWQFPSETRDLTRRNTETQWRNCTRGDCEGLTYNPGWGYICLLFCFKSTISWRKKKKTLKRTKLWTGGTRWGSRTCSFFCFLYRLVDVPICSGCRRMFTTFFRVAIFGTAFLIGCSKVTKATNYPQVPGSTIILLQRLHCCPRPPPALFPPPSLLRLYVCCTELSILQLPSIHRTHGTGYDGRSDFFCFCLGFG